MMTTPPLHDTHDGLPARLWASKIHVPDLCSQKLKHNLPLCSLLLHCLAMAPKAAATSAEQPVARPLGIGELSKNSVRTGATWDILIYNPFEDTYKYQWGKDERSTTVLLLTLVDAADPTQYCQGQFKKNNKNQTQYADAVKKFTHGTRFLMKKVHFDENAKTQFNSCTLKAVVDLSKTVMDPSDGADSAAQPVPTASIAGSSGLGTSQYFDVTAVIQSVGSTTTHDNNRSSLVVYIHDGTQDKEKKKVTAMPLKCFFNTAEGGAAQPKPNSVALSVVHSAQRLRSFLEDHQKKKKAVSFFSVSGSQDSEHKFRFQTTKYSFVATAVGTKAQRLNGDAELHKLQLEDMVAFDIQTGRAARDWSQELGIETRCKLLATFARTATGLPELDNGETIWQINCVRISVPPEDENIKNNDGTRLWLRLTLADESGPIVLHITEQAVIKLANVQDAAEFELLHSEGRLRFPFWASVKVWRRPGKPSSDSSNKDCFDCFIVDAAQQDANQTFTIHSTRLLTMLTQSVDGVLPTHLGMLRHSEHYAMAVEYTTQVVPPELTKSASKTVAGVPMMRPCSGAVALVLSFQRSKPEAAGLGGHKLVTDNVIDYADKDEPAAAKKYTITSYCTLDTITDFKLDPPPRATSRAALISVTGLLVEDSAEQPIIGLIANDVQHLPLEEADELLPILNKMFWAAAMAGQITRKRNNEGWDADDNPLRASPCRRLGRSPTGEELPNYVSAPP